PRLCCKKRDRKSQPERDPEELVWRESAKGKEHADNRTRSRHTQSNGIGSNHPLAGPCHFLSPYVHIGLESGKSGRRFRIAWSLRSHWDRRYSFCNSSLERRCRR